jgi:hypothetical protein
MMAQKGGVSGMLRFGARAIRTASEGAARLKAAKGQIKLP